MRPPGPAPTASLLSRRYLAALILLSIAGSLLGNIGCGGSASSSGGGGGGGKTTTPPPQPLDITPINGEVYYVLNQSSGLEADLINNSITAGDHIVQQAGSFSNLSQRWAFTALSGGTWMIGNIVNGFCLDSLSSLGSTWVVQNPCASASTQKWQLSPTSNGYYTITNAGTGLLADVI